MRLQGRRVYDSPRKKLHPKKYISSEGPLGITNPAYRNIFQIEKTVSHPLTPPDIEKLIPPQPNLNLRRNPATGAKIKIPVEMPGEMPVVIPVKDAIVISGQTGFDDPAAFHHAMVRGVEGSPILRDDEDQKRKAGSKILNFAPSTAPPPPLPPLF